MMGTFAIAIVQGLPVLLVVGALWACARPDRLSRRALITLAFVDLLWCAASLLAKQVSFQADAGIAWQASALWGTLFTVLGPPWLLMLIPSQHWRGAASWGVVAAASLVLIADSLYSRWFGDMFPAVALLAAGHAGDLVPGAWSLVASGDIWRFADVVLVIPLLIIKSRLPGPDASPKVLVRARLGLGAVVLLAAWQSVAAIRAAPSTLAQRFSNQALAELTGPLMYHVVDGWLFVRRRTASQFVSDETFQEVQGWFVERQDTRSGLGPWFGAALGMNLLVIQVESLQQPMVELRINGQEVMPNLARLQASSLSFSQVYDQTDEGRTSDAEWLLNTSLLPEPRGAAAFIDAGNHLVGLPSVLAARGYRPLSAVAFSPSFWNRRVMHPNYGYSRNVFAADFEPGEKIGWGLNDRDFLLQMRARLSASPQPFVAHLITQSLHYPFESFPERHQVLNVTPWNGTPLGNYLHGMRYFDRALGDLMAALDRHGLRDRTVVVVTGDHSVGFPWDSRLAHALGHANDLPSWSLAERVPLVVRVPGTTPTQIRLPMGQVDIAPTLLALLGVDSQALPYMGRNMLGAPGTEPVVRRDGSWVDARHLFLAKSLTTGTHCYARDSLRDVPLDACTEGSALAQRAVETARRTMEYDLQQRLRDEAPVAVRQP